MSTTLIEVRRAKPSDARAIATTHDDAWRNAYQGIIPGPELDKLINRRGPVWWDAAVQLFSAARRDLVQSGLHSLVVWALSDNEQAVGFYRALGGKAVARSSERFGARTLDKVAFAWTN